MNIFDASVECAIYIMDSDCEQVSYRKYVQDGNDPRDHIFYLAAIVLDKTDDFQSDINTYLNKFQKA